MYKIGDNVLFIIHRCPCIGGGITELVGPIVGILEDPHGPWYQINTLSGIQYVRGSDIKKIYG